MRGRNGAANSCHGNLTSDLLSRERVDDDDVVVVAPEDQVVDVVIDHHSVLDPVALHAREAEHLDPLVLFRVIAVHDIRVTAKVSVHVKFACRIRQFNKHNVVSCLTLYYVLFECAYG